MNDQEKATKLLQKFSGRSDFDHQIVNIELPETAAVMGNLVGLIYEADKDDEVAQYIHEFDPASQPVLAVSPNGKQLFIVGGRFQVTSRGIVDR